MKIKINHMIRRLQSDMMLVQHICLGHILIPCHIIISFQPIRHGLLRSE